MIDGFKRTRRVCLVMAGVFVVWLLAGGQAFCAGETGSGDGVKTPGALILLPGEMNAVVVEKSSQRLLLFSTGSQGVYERFQVACSTGAVAGAKLRSGDQKTPEGIFFLTDVYEDRYLSPVYGKKAFPTDYPNYIDRKNGRGGSAIWLHGTNKPLKPMDSNGCVAMNNPDILKLAPYLEPGATPVVITDTIVYAEPATINQERKALLSLVSRWERAIESGSRQDYLRFYDSDGRPDFKWWKAWSATRERAAQENLGFDVLIDSPGIYREGSVFVVFFNMKIALGARRQTLGKRKLFVEKKAHGYRITGDIFQTFPRGERDDVGILVAAAEGLYHGAVSKSLPQEVLDK